MNFETALSHPSLREIVASLTPKLKIGFKDPEEETLKLRQLQEAVELATELHESQPRKNGEAYINHIIRVTRRLTNEYGVTDTDTVVAALLHDSVEDQVEKLCRLNGVEPIPGPEGVEPNRTVALSYITRRFGGRVSNLVKALTNPESKGKVSQEEWKHIYAHHVKELINEHPDLLFIKLSDFSDNALKLRDEIDDPKELLRLSTKYLPAMRIFLNKISGPNALPKDVQVLISQKLSSTIAEIEGLAISYGK